MDYILKRFQEPSTFAGIAALFSGFGLLGLTAQDWNQILGAAVSLAGAAAVVLKEKPDAKP
jgi:hypothetical protein